MGIMGERSGKRRRERCSIGKQSERYVVGTLKTEIIRAAVWRRHVREMRLLMDGIAKLYVKCNRGWLED